MAGDGTQPTKLLPRGKAKKEIGAKLKFNTTATKCYQSCVSETQDPKQSVIQAKKIDIKLWHRTQPPSSFTARTRRPVKKKKGRISFTTIK